MSDLGFDASLKKKKKVKKTEESESPAPEAGADDMFAGMKKKKKSKKTDDSLADAGADDSLSSEFSDLSIKKKKKKSTKNLEASDFDQQLEQAGIEDNVAAKVDSPSGDSDSTSPSASVSAAAGEMPYETLLSRFFTVLKTNNPELAGDRSGPKFRIPPPICQREGSKKTLFSNVQDIATVLQRNPEHLIQFLFAELGTSGSIDGEKRLVLRGKFQPKQMESVLRRYIIEYVTCKTCKSMNTELKRESANRLHFLSCKACGSTRSVSSIKTGFQAQIGRRKRA